MATNAAIWALLLILAQGIQFPNAPASQTEQPDPAVLEGFVVQQGTATPVTRAQVRLVPVEGTGADASAPPTDGGGRFVFESVQPGEYRLTVERQGYVGTEFGQRRPEGAGSILTLRPGERVSDIVVAMTPTGVISGRIYDRYGEPVVNGQVQALQYRYQNGARTMAQVKVTQTNDRGEYRLFWLDPGEYFISATADSHVGAPGDYSIATSIVNGGAIRMESQRVLITRDASGIVGGNFSRTSGADDGDTGERFVPVYHPGTTDPALAVPIDLRPGVDYTGVDLLAPEVRTVSVRGRIVNAGTEPNARGLNVRLVPRSAIVGAQTIPSAIVGPDGAFSISGIVPGSYDLTATQNLVQAFVSPGGGETVFFNQSGGTRLFAWVPIEVGNADVDNVTLSLEPGFDIAGRVRIDTSSDNDSESAPIMVELRPNAQTAGLFGVPLAPARVDEDGTFTLTGLPPRGYRLELSGLPDGAYVRDARFEGVDAINGGFDLVGAPRGVLDIEIGMDSGSVDVRVVDSSDQPAPDIQAVLIPAPPRRERYDLYQSARSDSEGHVRFDGVAPGDYTVLAWEDIPEGAWRYPDYIRDYDGFGELVRVAPLGGADVSVILIPEN